MSAYGRSSQLASYQTISVHGAVADADPHQLVLMLMDGALERLAIARGCIERGNIVRKAAALHQSVSIVAELRGSLDMQMGGPLAQNLSELYDYMIRRLLLANATSDAGYVAEVSGLLAEIRTAWSVIGPEVRKPQRTASAA